MQTAIRPVKSSTQSNDLPKRKDYERQQQPEKGAVQEQEHEQEPLQHPPQSNNDNRLEISSKSKNNSAMTIVKTKKRRQ